MTPRERQKAIYHRLRAEYGDEVRGLDNISKEIGYCYHEASRKIASSEINLKTFKRGRSITIYTDELAKFLAAS